MDPFAERRRRYAAVWKVLGSAEGFARLPRQVQEHFWRYKLPDPVVEFEDGFPDDPALRREIEAAARGAELAVEGRMMSVRDVLGVIAGCYVVVRETPAADVAALPPGARAFFDAARPVIERVYEAHAQPAYTKLYHEVHAPVVAGSRLDARLLEVRMAQVEGAGGKPGVRVRLGAVRAEARQVRIDGAARPVYRVARPLGHEGVKWLSWDAEDLGLEGLGREVPVYVQSHALRQLQRRVNLPPVEPYLQAWLAESLAEPCIVERQGGDLLVEFRFHEDRLGYLIATPMRDEAGKPLIAVRTFLFLTMEPSPESRLLANRLRLSRRDADWLGLHDLAAFTQTDLLDDPVLRPMLEACGCGHLFALAEDGIAGADLAPQPKALAGEMKKYLRMAA